MFELLLSQSVVCVCGGGVQWGGVNSPHTYIYIQSTGYNNGTGSPLVMTLMSHTLVTRWVGGWGDNTTAEEEGRRRR
jgi:hypothetical protein